MSHHTPLRIAADVHLIRTLPEDREPPLLYTSSLVLTGAEPVVVDLGPDAGGESWWDQLEAVVDPGRVRWILLSHVGSSNTANLAQAVARLPRATLVAGWALAPEGQGRVELALGGHDLLLVRAPLPGPAPTVLVLDRDSSILWASTTFGAAVPHPVDAVGQIDLEVFERAFRDYHWARFSGLGGMEDGRLAAACRELAELELRAIASVHGPLVRGGQVPRVLELLVDLPAWPPAGDGGAAPDRLDRPVVRP